uniref:Uncharacterized protein n=1 Tax=Amphimedon queenslandica TaxID=400682 RepID=A0A5K1W153_AMPQE
MIDAWNE